MGAPKEIINRKAKFEYTLLQGFEAGISLVGTEVKSLRKGEASLKDAYCTFKKNELYVKNLFIAEYEFGNINNHETRRDRKLLLRKSELRKLLKQSNEKGFSIIPYRLYFSDRGKVKLEIFLAKGKKAYDKRQSIKERDMSRDINRIKKIRL